MPSITQLRYVLAVHRMGHFGKAAAACHVSQPTLSSQVQKVEEELGITIFVRASRPVGLTDKGRALMEAAHEVVAAHERLLQLAQGQFEELAGDLNLGVIPTLAPYVMPWFLKSFAERHPRVNLNILERTTEGIVSDLEARRLDAGLLATPLDVPALQERFLFRDPFYVYAAPSEAVLEEDEVNPKQLDPERLWLLEDGHCVRTQTLALCDLVEGCSHLSSVRFEAGSFETLRHLIDASEGYTIVPETYARLLPRDRRRAQTRPLGDPTPTREIGLVHPRSTWKQDLIDALEAGIRRHIPRSLREVQSGHVVPVRAPQAQTSSSKRRRKAKGRGQPSRRPIRPAR